MEIKNVKITKVGGSYYLLIPSDFIKYGNINTAKTYDIYIKDLI